MTAPTESAAILTDERIIEILIANAVDECDPRLLWHDTSSRAPTDVMRGIVRAIEADLRTTLAAVPGQMERVYQKLDTRLKPEAWVEIGEDEYNDLPGYGIFSEFRKRTLYAAQPSPVSAAPVVLVDRNAGELAKHEYAVIAMLPDIHSKLREAYRLGAQEQGQDAKEFAAAEKLMLAWDLPDADGPARPIVPQPAVPQDAINGPLTDAQKQQAQSLYRTLHHLGPDAMADVVRYASVCGYVNGRKDFAPAVQDAPSDEQTLPVCHSALRAEPAEHQEPVAYLVRNPRTGKARFMSKSKKHLIDHWHGCGYEVIPMVAANSPTAVVAAPVSGEVVARPDPEPPDTASQKQIADWHARQIPDQTGEKK